MKLLLLHATPFLVANQHDRSAIQGSRTRQNSMIVAESAVAVQLKEIFAHELNVIGSIGSIFMTCHLYCLPRGKISINLLGSATQVSLGIQQLTVLVWSQAITLTLQIGDPFF